MLIDLAKLPEELNAEMYFECREESLNWKLFLKASIAKLK